MSERFGYGARVWIAGRAGVIVGYEDRSLWYYVVWRNGEKLAASGAGADAVSARSERDLVDNILALNGGVKMATEQAVTVNIARGREVATVLERAVMDTVVSAKLPLQQQVDALKARMDAIEGGRSAEMDRLWQTVIEMANVVDKHSAALGGNRGAAGDDSGRVTVDGVTMTEAQYAALQSLLYEAGKAAAVYEPLHASLDLFEDMWFELSHDDE